MDGKENIKKALSVYIAGSLFNEAEIAQRIKEEKLLQEKFPSMKIFNPITQPFNDKSNLPTPEEIFKGDYKAVKESDIFIADLTNNDPGLMVELGIAIESKKIILGVLSDIRLKTANKYSIPTFGFNHFVYGGILVSKGKVLYNFQEVIEEIEKIQQ